MRDRIAAVWIASLLAVAAFGPGAGAAGAVASRPCTITGTSGNDRLIGTPGPDVICAKVAGAITRMNTVIHQRMGGILGVDVG